METMEKIGTALEGAVEIVGESPCPTPDCGGTGMHVRVFQRHLHLICEDCQKQAEALEAEVERRENVERLLTLSGGKTMPVMFAWSLESYPKDEAAQAALATGKRWLAAYLDTDPRERRPNLVLYGPVGSGKTGLAWGLARKLIEEHQVETKFVIFHDLLGQIKEAIQKKVPFDAYSNIGKIPLLVLDDVGAERVTDWTVNELLTLVDRRYQRNLPTVYTSNYEPDALAERLGHNDEIVGARIVSRMIDGSIQHRVRSDDRRRSA